MLYQSIIKHLASNTSHGFVAKHAALYTHSATLILTNRTSDEVIFLSSALSEPMSSDSK